MALILHQRSLFLLKNMISCNMYHIVPSVLKPTKYFFFCVKCIYTKLDTNVCRFQAEKLCTILDLCQTLSSWVWPASLTDQYRGSINYPSLTEISVCVVCGEIPGSQQLQFQKLIKKCLKSHKIVLWEKLLIHVILLFSMVPLLWEKVLRQEHQWWQFVRRYSWNSEDDCNSAGGGLSCTNGGNPLLLILCFL